ncbi:PDZ domain-containing protein [Actinopolymorpha cephalotaxi]|uniref:endopeptidase La n=1 Tax=Actinopolymorpha cephalotaxi TaxID=504797 RepID=A0A1I2Z2K0_9ACTN|nr:PDZ domain-containing protein [Actinopolymorpha cephalotaxi]NYH81829.1 PDZ domain-containing protein [Actinopolymorpha cephalotaxi]SFH32092.1 PDZ domain-containing protein [Actinopolymorpha cephalotaxi]
MSRRTATMALTAVLLVALVALAWLVPVPYVAMSPGPTENTLGKFRGKPVVTIQGHRTYPTKGQLDLTTVAVTSPDQKLDLAGMVAGWLDPRVAVIPRDYVYPPNQTPAQVQQQNAEQMETSQQAAVAAALRQTGDKVTSVVQVKAVVEKSPAVGRLKAADVILAVDGTKVTSAQQVVALVGRHRPGDKLRFSVRRGGKPREVSVTTTKSPTDAKRAFVGIQPFDGFQFPFAVRINLGQDIGGPSAGTMFALAIVDKLTAGELTGGRHVAGTGTIDADGKVGPIGGIQQKIAGAKEGGATTFLVPAANCPAAAGASTKDIRLVRIATLRDAVSALEALNKNPRATVPTCSRG